MACATSGRRSRLFGSGSWRDLTNGFSPSRAFAGTWCFSQRCFDTPSLDGLSEYLHVAHMIMRAALSRCSPSKARSAGSGPRADLCLRRNHVPQLTTRSPSSNFVSHLRRPNPHGYSRFLLQVRNESVSLAAQLLTKVERPHQHLEDEEDSGDPITSERHFAREPE